MDNFTIDSSNNLPPTADRAKTLAQAQEHIASFLQQQLDMMARTGDQFIPPAEWFNILRYNKIPNFLTDNLIQSRPEFSEIRDQLESYRLRTKFLNARGLWQIDKITQILYDNEIDFVFFKGVLAQGYWYSDYFLKPSGDIDILVHRGSFQKAKDALSSLDYFVEPGYETSWWTGFMGEQHLTSKTIDSPKIDLHYRIQKPGLPQPLFIENFLTRRQFYQLGDVKVPILSDFDHFLISAVSIIKAIYNREACLDHITDALVFLLSLPPDELVLVEKHSKKHGLLPVVRLTIRIVDIIFPNTKISDMAHKITIMDDVEDNTLKTIVFCPKKTANYWPRRRRLLWELCGHSKTRFARESGWALLAELSRWAHQRK